MSHTFKAVDGTLFHFNSDLSGPVTINGACEVSGRALIEFAAHHVRQQRIAALEQADDWRVLGLEV